MPGNFIDGHFSLADILIASHNPLLFLGILKSGLKPLQHNAGLKIMSESVDCPYCGQTVRTQKEVDYDNKIKLRCSSCGGLFEYMPGFGSFSLPGQDRHESVRYEGPTEYGYDDPGVYETEVPWTVERPSQTNDCGKGCIIFCILCFILPVISWIIFFFSLFDLIFF
jgi:hypothetical protein